MNFHEYLDMRAAGRSPLNPIIEALRQARVLPANPTTWADLCPVLEAAAIGQDGVAAARTVWWAYRRYLDSIGLPQPVRPPTPSCAIPGSTGTVSDAEPLVRLRQLGYEPRKIGRQIDYKTWEWFGDLENVVERRKYLLMLWDHGAVTQFSYFPGAARMPVLFARVRQSVDPAMAYRIASDQVEQSLKHNPRWLVTRTPYVGLGALR
jgi:hypothetical protein